MMTKVAIATGMSFIAPVFAAFQDPTIGSAQETVVWLIRAILALGLGACAYLLREAATTMKDTKTQVAQLAITVATHQIMFEHWIDTLSDAGIDPTNPGRRMSDKLIKEIITRSSTMRK